MAFDKVRENELIGLTPQALVEVIAGGSLTTKKQILEYIADLRSLSKTVLEASQVEGSYELINEAIEALKASVKPNTIMFLKNELRQALGKYVQGSQEEENTFLRFFKEAYAHQTKSKQYTWVLMDLSRISEQQILETLKVINTFAMKNRLSSKEKEDTYPMLERIVDTQNVRLINQLRSMEGIRKAFNLKIIEEKGHFCILKLKK